MPLKAKIANKVQTNDEGLIEGTIRVFEVDEKYKDVKGKEIDEEEYKDLKAKGKKPDYFEPQFDFVISVDGSQKTVSYHIWTGKNFNNEKFEQCDNDYNKFTRLMLQLELITESDLEDLENSEVLNDFDVESVDGLKITFELEPSKKDKKYKVPKLTSIKPVKPPK